MPPKAESRTVDMLCVFITEVPNQDLGREYTSDSLMVLKLYVCHDLRK